eukprot:scaffold7159_cov64-Attheya_sp.AAC.1
MNSVFVPHQSRDHRLTILDTNTKTIRWYSIEKVVAICIKKRGNCDLITCLDVPAGCDFLAAARQI